MDSARLSSERSPLNAYLAHCSETSLIGVPTPQFEFTTEVLFFLQVLFHYLQRRLPYPIRVSYTYY